MESLYSKDGYTLLAWRISQKGFHVFGYISLNRTLLYHRIPKIDQGFPFVNISLEGISPSLIEQELV